LLALSFILAGVAVWEKAANVAGFTILRGDFTASRLLDYATVCLLFVIALLLLDVKGALEARRPL
ncbi:MAG: hypothetical protein ACRD1Z_14535, partial [Vicinamibacteria bacterium]